MATPPEVCVGDVVILTYETWLMVLNRKVEDVDFLDDTWVFDTTPTPMLNDGSMLLVLASRKTGSVGLGRAYYVLSYGEPSSIGWVCAHEVRRAV